MKSFKKIAVSFLLVLAMICTMVGTFATETANTITSVTYSTSIDGENWVACGETIKITSESMIKVDVQLASAGEVTLMSYKKDATEYNNSTIQYVTQKTSGTNNIASIQFRPRTTLTDGTYVIKIGAEGVATASTREFTIDNTLRITTVYNNICYADPTETASATNGVYYAEDVIYDLNLKVKDDAVITISGNGLESPKPLVEGTDYFVPDGEPYRIIIKPDAIVTDPANKTTLANGTYTLSVTNGGSPVTSTINVCPDVLYKNASFAYVENNTIKINGDATRILCAPAIPDSDTTKYSSGYKVSLRPVKSIYSVKDPKTKVMAVNGAVLGWVGSDSSDGHQNYVPEHNGEYVNYTDNVKVLEARTNWGTYYDKNTSSTGTELKTMQGDTGDNKGALSEVTSQNITYTKADGTVQNAIRFIAMIDTKVLFDESKEEYNTTAKRIAAMNADSRYKVYFVLSDISLFPNKEENAFPEVAVAEVYKQIKAFNGDETVSKTVEELTNAYNTAKGTSYDFDCIATVVLDIDNTDAIEGFERAKQRIGATAYLELPVNANRISRLYGKSTAPAYSGTPYGVEMYGNPFKYQGK